MSNPFKKWILWVVLIGIYPPAIWPVTAFLPNTKLFLPDMIWSANPEERANRIFQNSAAIGDAEHPQISIRQSKEVTDYTRITLAGILPGQWVSGGAGIDYMSSSFIASGSVDPLTGRPIETGTFTDTLLRINAGISYPVMSTLYIGASVSQFLRSIHTSSATATSADLSLFWKATPELSVGVWMEYAWAPNISWTTPSGDNSQTKLAPTLNLEAQYRFQEWLVGAMWDSSSISLGGRWFLSPQFSLLGSAAIATDQTLNRYALGSKLTFTPFSIEYSYVVFSGTLFENNQHILGIGVLL